MENVNEHIRKHYHKLTNQQKLVAKLILDEPKQIALHPAKVIGTLTGTSETTVIRMCYALGYSGYSALQNEIRESLLLPHKKDKLLENYSKDQMDESDVITCNMEQDLAYIQKMLNEIKPEQIQRAVESIVKAKKVIVVGFRSSHGPATWLTSTLNVVKGNAHLYRGQTDDANYLITEVNAKCVVIAFSFPRYTKETIVFSQAAKEKGARIIAITDDELSPIGPIADTLIKIATPAPTALKGMATIFSLLNVLVSGIVQADRRNVQARIKQYDESGQLFYPFFEAT
ncbi:MurR/RpiR family transcriptional regulator [Brevibacillus ruminantium]|uniref:MurR/RpiR family transcriptional regulator n=1 Tax=Brevibacillus ruminantium TaxID=2950604 RepID=A0ABY4WBC6_9BACL|nr:MurR/RpiR family transcriptional regulator [Brevibacillus ruminantium]USG64064.1 MurR/RpiR family transcriptional regulator [Brevibacillus ruminantium]